MSFKPTKKLPKEPARFRLVQDDSCHWYAIPADSVTKFEAWVEYMSGDYAYAPYKGEEFDAYRLSMHPSSYSFTDLQEDRT